MFMFIAIHIALILCHILSHSALIICKTVHKLRLALLFCTDSGQNSQLGNNKINSVSACLSVVEITSG